MAEGLGHAYLRRARWARVGVYQQWYSKVPAVVHKSTSSGTQKYQQWYSKVPALELESTSSEMEVVRRARLSGEAEMVARSGGRQRWWRGQAGGRDGGEVSREACVLVGTWNLGELVDFAEKSYAK